MRSSLLPVPEDVEPTPRWLLGVAAAAVAAVGITFFGWESGYESGGLVQTTVGAAVAGLAVLLVIRDRL